MYRIGPSPAPRGWRSQAQRDLDNARLAAEEEAARAAAASPQPELPPPDAEPPPVEPEPLQLPSPSGDEAAGEPAVPTPPPEDPQPAASPPSDENPEPPEPHERVLAWMNEHWDRVLAMAMAGEAPVRPPPPSPEPPEQSEAAGEPPPPPYVEPEHRWTKWKMAQFLRHLAATHSVTEAAAAVKMSRNSAYKLRSRLKGQPFDIGWEAATRHGYDNLSHAAIELALEGEDVPHYYQGELVGTHKKRHPQMIVQLLKMRNREGAPTLGRYNAAAEYFSEDWERMTRRIETGSATWKDEQDALGAEERARLSLPDERQRVDRIIERNAPDEPRKGRSPL
jgi:hypothetical protein